MFPIAITYAIWIPVQIVFYFLFAYFSKKNNESKNKRFMAIMICLNLIPLWAFIAPDSQNLAFDGLLYDVIMVLVFTSTLAYLGSGVNFQKQNWIGVIVIIIGFVLMKL